MSFTPSPELRFVFRAADPRCEAAELLALSTQIQDWQRVARLTESEGATAVLWRLLRPHAAQLPMEFVIFLQARTMLADFRMQRLAQRAQDTVAALRGAGIDVLLLKGAAVGAITDPTFRLRPMTDVDLLIGEADAERAKACVLDLDWVEMPEPRLRELLQGHQHMPPFVDPTLEGLRLELHTRLLPADSSFDLTAADLWRHASPAQEPFAGAQVPDLARLAVHSAVHFAWQHEMRFGPWRTFRSFALLTQQAGWDWTAFITIARAARASTSCYWTLRMARTLAGMDVPQAALTALAAPSPEFVRRILDRHFTAVSDPLERPPSPSDRLSTLLWRMALRPRWSGHRAVSRFDPERRWERAFSETPVPEGMARVRRHVGARGDWWAFLTRTIAGR
jgi:hypothetical protein